jgi:putative transposase
LATASASVAHSSAQLGSRSWFKIKQFEIESASPSSRSLAQAITSSALHRIEEREEPHPKKKQRQKKKLDSSTEKKEKEIVGRCLKWRIFPTESQRKVFHLWCDAVRWSYNRGAEYVNKSRDWSLKGIRQAMHTAVENWKVNAPERMRDSVPYEIRDSAAQDINKACAALKAKEKKFKRNLKFKRKKDARTSITLGSRQLNCKTDKGSVWPALFGTIKDRSAMQTEKGKSLPLIFEHDCRLVYDRVINQFFICIPSAAVTRPDTQGPVGPWADQFGDVCGRSIVSIDPGIKTFATCYNPDDGGVYKWGDKPWLLAWLSRKCDRLATKAREHCGHSRRRILKVAARVRRHITDLVSELHRKFSLWLCRNFSVVLLPKFSPKRCGQRKNLPFGKRRSLCKKTTRRLMQLGHFRFRQSLQHKCKEFDTKLEVCSEAYTSMTCGHCGRLNRKLTLRDRVYTCPSCEWTADRDANGARNVLLRYLSTEKIAIEDLAIRPFPAGCFMPL